MEYAKLGMVEQIHSQQSEIQRLNREIMRLQNALDFERRKTVEYKRVYESVFALYKQAEEKLNG
jgi:uncharacterized protein YlxW (UPF0749 family)